MFETTGYDMKSGPQISSSVGRLIACTCPQRWPFLPPRSRNHRPPGHGSSVIGNGLPSGFSFNRPRLAIRESNVGSSAALTRTSSVVVRVRLSSVVAASTSSPLLAFRVSFNTVQLAAPVLLECARPVVDRFQRLRVRAVEHAL